MSWAQSTSNTSEIFYGAELVENAGAYHALVGLDYPASDYVSKVDFPVWSGSSWTGQAMFPSTSSGTGVITGLGLVKCESEIFAVGRDAGTYFRAIPVTNLNTVTLGTPLTNATSISFADRASCVGINTSGPNSARIFLMYSTSSASHQFFSFEAPSPVCGGTAGALLGGGNNLGTTPSSGGYADVKGVKIGAQQGFLAAYASSPYPTKLTFIPLLCTAGSVGTGTGPEMWGSLAAPSTELRGIMPMAEMYAGPSSPHTLRKMMIFGDKHQIYHLEAR